jgi:dTMP kinase
VVTRSPVDQDVPPVEEAKKKTRRSRFSRRSADESAAQPQDRSRDVASSAEETAVLPVVDPQAGRPLPRAWREAAPRSAESVQDKVPEWLFRPEPGLAGSEAPTTQIPAVAPTTEPDVADESDAARARGGRYDWAEETPLDDLPTLTDQLLGTKEEWAQWHAEHPGEERGPEGHGRAR